MCRNTSETPQRPEVWPHQWWPTPCLSPVRTGSRDRAPEEESEARRAQTRRPVTCPSRPVRTGEGEGLCSPERSLSLLQLQHHSRHPGAGLAPATGQGAAGRQGRGRARLSAGPHPEPFLTEESLLWSAKARVELGDSVATGGPARPRPCYTAGWGSRTFQRLERARKKKYMTMRKSEEAT